MIACLLIRSFYRARPGLDFAEANFEALAPNCSAISSRLAAELPKPLDLGEP